MPDFGKDYLAVGQLGLDAKRIALAERFSKESAHTQQVRKSGGLAGNKGVADKEVELDSAARQFEALLLHQMMQSMWRTVPGEGLLSGSREEELYRDMLNETLATNISQGNGIGIRNIVARDMKKYDKTE